MKLSKKEIERLKDGVKIKDNDKVDDLESDAEDDILSAKYPGSAASTASEDKDKKDRQ